MWKWWKWILFFSTYKNSIIGFITFRFQFHHILDKNFGVSAQERFDALYMEQKKIKQSQMSINRNKKR